MQAVKALELALESIFSQMGLEWPAKLVIEAPKQAGHGDLATNAAMLLARQAGRKPRELAEELAQRLPGVCPEIEKVEVAGPGFCNVTFRPELWISIVGEIEEKGGAFGSSDAGAGKSALVEYVSANPTGPLHVGHARGAALGDSVARLLRASGYAVSTEYYLNDAGRQMRVLGQSIWIRAMQASGRELELPEDCYRGDYIIAIAKDILREKPGLPEMDREAGEEFCRQWGMREILREIRDDLAKFRCQHERFASEAELNESGAVARTLEFLRLEGKSYEKDGALWLATAARGDDHDRVLRKSDGSLTYFASDIAYHHDKFGRGHQWLIDVWGADHHGYIARMRAAIAEMGDNPEKFSVMLVQLVNLLRDGEKVSMSTRAGEFITLAQLVDEVGVDAARFMFLSRSCDSPLDFDLELAKKRSLDNPVYYAQYAHARVSALLRRAGEKGIELAGRTPPDILDALANPEDLALLRILARFEETVAGAAKNLAPHHITRYVLELAGAMHSYYAHRKILDDSDPEAARARLAMLRACGQTIRNALFLLGVSAPESM